MALIGTLRTRMTKVVVGFVAIAMIAFIVGTDLFGNGPRSIFGGDRNIAGEIAGHTVMIDEYQSAVQARERNFSARMGRMPNDRDSYQLRNEAWELLILKYAIYPQFDKVGVRVTADEQYDMVQGKNVAEELKTAPIFQDSSGKFDRMKLISWLKTLDDPNNPQRAQWDIFKQDLIAGRERLKYDYLLTKTNYITSAEAERDYHNQNDVAEVKYLSVPYASVSDTLVNPTNSDFEKYYNKTKEKYRVDQSRDLLYVTFPVVPSHSDSVALKTEMDKLFEGLKNTSDDSLYATANTEGTTPYAKYTVATLPTYLSSQRANLKTGAMFGPNLEGGVYKVMKVVKVGTDSTYSARASHILIKWDSDTPAAKKAAKEKAQKILRDIRGGANFAAKALEFGTDGTRTRGGDLGWFSSGAMVKPFQDAVFAARKTGPLSDVVETEFGYHVIDVTGVKDNTTYTIATIEHDMTPSDETDNLASQKADAFAHDLSGVDAFRAKAKNEGLSIFEGKEIGANDRSINNLSDARSIVSWLYREGSVDKVSEVFNLRNNYVVAVMSGKTDEGIKPLDKVKDEITPAVKDELKAKIIIDKLATMTGSLDEIAKAYGPDATVGASSDVKMNSNSLSTLGFEPVAVGVAFSLENGKRSKPFAGEKGVLIVDLQSKTNAPEIGDYTMFKNQLLQNLEGRTAYSVTEAIKKAADIKDRRYRFY